MPWRTWNSPRTVIYVRCENSSWPQVHAYTYWSGEQRFRHFLPLLSLLFLCCSIRQMTKICYSFFFRMTIICAIFSCSYCWTIEIWLIILLATGKSGELFRGTYFFRAKLLFPATVVCFISIRLKSVTNTFLFPYSWLTGTGIHHLNHAINRCWQCFFDYLKCESFCQHHEKQNWIYWTANDAEMLQI